MFAKHVSPVSVKHTQRAKVDTERDTPTSPLALKAEADRKPNTRNRDDELAPPPPHPNARCGFHPAVVVALGETCAHVSEDEAWKEAGDGGHRSAAPGRNPGPLGRLLRGLRPPSRSNTRTSPLTSPVPAKPSPWATAMREFMSTWMFRESKTQSDATQTYHTHTHE